MLFNSYSYKILYEQFHWIYLQGDIKLSLVTVNNRLKFEIEIVHDLSCHPIVTAGFNVALNTLFLYNLHINCSVLTSLIWCVVDAAHCNAYYMLHWMSVEAYKWSRYNDIHILMLLYWQVNRRFYIM